MLRFDTLVKCRAEELQLVKDMRELTRRDEVLAAVINLLRGRSEDPTDLSTGRRRSCQVSCQHQGCGDKHARNESDIVAGTCLADLSCDVKHV